MSAFTPVLAVKAASPYRAWAKEYSGVHNQKNDCAGAPCRLHTAGNQAQEGTRVYHWGPTAGCLVPTVSATNRYSGRSVRHFVSADPRTHHRVVMASGYTLYAPSLSHTHGTDWIQDRATPLWDRSDLDPQKIALRVS